MEIDCGFSNYDYLSLPELNSCEDHRHVNVYNNLPSVEEADAMLRARGDFFDFLNAASALAYQNNLAETMGLRLLHNHFYLEQGQVMFENYLNRSLITSAHNISEIQNDNILPHGWIFSDSGALEVFEFSSDSVVQSAIDKIRESGFLAKMHNLMVEHKMHNLFALSVLTRDNLKHEDGYIFLEVNNDDTKQSVVQLAKTNFTNSNIRTSWSFSDATQHRCLETWWECVVLPGLPGHTTRPVHNDH